MAVGDRVQLVALAAAAESRIGPFAVGVVVDEYERALAGQSLCDVGGHRVAVLYDAVAAPCAALEKRTRQRPLTGGEADGQGARGGINRGHGASVAVAHVQAP